MHVILLCILTLLKAFCARRINLKKLFSFFFDRIINKLISTYQPRVCNLYMGQSQIETLHSKAEVSDFPLKTETFEVNNNLGITWRSSFLWFCEPMGITGE